MTWAAVLIGSALTYGIKLAGLTVPRRLLDGARVRRLADVLPVALLMALVALGTVTTGHRLVLDARLAGVTVGVLALRLRVGFLGVVVSAAATTALLRALGVG